MHAANVGMGAKEETLAAVAVGPLPSSLQGIVDGMSNEAAKWEAKMQLLGSSEYYRDTPWVLVMAAVMQLSDQIDL